MRYYGDYDVGDLVKDPFDHKYIVISLERNRENNVFRVSLFPLTKKPINPDNDGLCRMFPTDVSILNYGNK